MTMDIQRLRSEEGFTIVEVLMAVALILVGLTALVAAAPTAIQGITGSGKQSTAVFLAEQRLEQIKAWSASTAGGQGWATIANGTPSTAACCTAEAYGTIANYGAYRREVYVSNGPTANTKNVQVRVFYATVSGSETRSTLSTLLLSE